MTLWDIMNALTLDDIYRLENITLDNFLLGKSHAGGGKVGWHNNRFFVWTFKIGQNREQPLEELKKFLPSEDGESNWYRLRKGTSRDY